MCNVIKGLCGNCMKIKNMAELYPFGENTEAYVTCDICGAVHIFSERKTIFYQDEEGNTCVKTTWKYGTK